MYFGKSFSVSTFINYTSIQELKIKIHSYFFSKALINNLGFQEKRIKHY